MPSARVRLRPMNSPEALALLAALLFGTATTLSKLGLRYVSPRAGAAISLSATALMFWAVAPFQLNLSGVSAEALGLFAVIGVFFPALVSILNFEATLRMGPTVSSAVTSTSAAFALLTAILFLDEPFTSDDWLGDVDHYCRCGGDVLGRPCQQSPMGDLGLVDSAGRSGRARQLTNLDEVRVG